MFRVSGLLTFPCPTCFWHFWGKFLPKLLKKNRQNAGSKEKGKNYFLGAGTVYCLRVHSASRAEPSPARVLLPPGCDEREVCPGCWVQAFAGGGSGGGHFFWDQKVFLSFLTQGMCPGLSRPASLPPPIPVGVGPSGNLPLPGREGYFSLVFNSPKKFRTLPPPPWTSTPQGMGGWVPTNHDVWPQLSSLAAILFHSCSPISVHFSCTPQPSAVGKGSPRSPNS